MALIIVTVTNRLEIKGSIPARVRESIRSRLTFTNPRWEENEKRGFSNWNTPREIRGYHIEGDRLTLPRGCGRQVVSILHRAGVQYQIDDRRRVLVDFSFNGTIHGRARVYGGEP